MLASQSNEILTAIVQGMRKEEPSNNVRLAATKALYNSLEFTKANFEKEVRLMVYGWMGGYGLNSALERAALYHASGV